MARAQHYSNGCAMPVQTATSVQGAMAAINFIGTSITVIGEKGTNFGIGAFAIDGGALTTVDTYSATKLNQQALFTASGLANEPHVLTYQVTCNKNAASSGYYQVLDAYTVTGTNNPFANAAQNSKGANNITLGGSGWTCGGDAADISGSQCWDGTAGDSITYTFTGSLAEVFIRPDVGDGYFDVQIDGTTVAHDVSGQYTTTDNDQLDAWMAFAKSGLSSGTHTMKLIVDGSAPYPNEAENSGQKNLLQFDVGLSFAASGSSTPTPAATPTPIGQATICNPVTTLPANNSILTQGNITVGATANCNGTYDHIRWSWGLVSPSGETDFANIPSGSSTAVMNASTQVPGAYQEAAAVYLANGSIVTSNGNGGWSPLFHYTLNAAPTPTPVPPTPTPTVVPTPIPTPTPSANCTEITTSGPTINVSGNLWSFSPTFQALENGAVFGGSGANLADMTLSGGAIFVFYPPTSTWYVSSPAGTEWNNGQSAGPSCPGVTPTPTPLPPTPTPTIAPTPTPTTAPTSTPTIAPTSTPTPGGVVTPTCPPGYTLECPNCVLTPPPPTPVPSPTPAPLVMKANDFLNIFGYTTHHGQGKITAAQIEQGLTYTGVRHYRDDGTNNPSLLSDYCAIHSATGATMIMLPFGGDVTDTTAFLDTLAQCNALMAVEGQNEANNQPFLYGSDVCDPDNHLGHGNISHGCGAFQRDFYAAKKADPNLAALPMLAPTEMGDQNTDNAGLQFLSIPLGSGLEFPDGTVYADYANIHPYDNCATNPPRDNDAWSMAAPVASDQGCYDGMNGEFEGATWRNHFPAYPITSDANGNITGTFIPYLATESGQGTTPELSGGISYDIQGKVYTDLALDAALRGATHWFVYQMGEEGDGLGAVYTASFTYKLGATYMHNLTTILADTSSAFAPVAVTPTFSPNPLPSTMHSLLMQKSNGTYELVVWAEAFTSESEPDVTVTLDKPYSTVNVYDITQGTTPVASTSGGTITLPTLTDHALVVEFHN